MKTQSVKKKKKHWLLRILVFLLLLFLAAAVILGIRLVPAARRLQRALTAQNCAITAKVSLNPQELTADQQKFLQILSGLTGLSEEEWQELILQGGYDGKAMELEIFGRQDTLLTQLYLTQDCQAINLHTIYDIAYAHLTEKAGLLERVLPQWSLGDYISLQQLEDAFGLELGEFPDVQGKLERMQSKLSLPLACGIILAADEWDGEERKLVYHITDTDRRLALIRQMVKKTGNVRQADYLRLPEGMELDMVIYLGEPQVHMRITGRVPDLRQLTDWSVELFWGGYTTAGDRISMIDQQVLNDLAGLLELLELFRKQ